MPSFRAVQEITDVRPGHAPEEVLTAAADACEASAHTVEARDLEVIAGRARIWVRFTVPETSEAEENVEAWEVADAICAGVRRVAFAGVAQPFRRVGGRWVRVARPVDPD
nr:hypothetical protein [Propionibacterium sp.]